MGGNKKPIIRSIGENLTEQALSKLCDKVFLKLWTYPNPYKKKGQELCDVLVVFEEHVFIFSVKDICFNKEKEINVSWSRWKNNAIDKSIKQIDAAESWIRTQGNKIFLDAKCENKIPININLDDYKVHRVIVAHGAEQACRESSEENIAGSLAISYSDVPSSDSKEGFDSFNLDIILEELDTIRDFLWYLEAKETAIKKYDLLNYCGEEDLLAHYLYNFDIKKECHYIGTKEKKINAIYIGEGEWNDFILTEPYMKKEEANKDSYFWDELLQRTLQNALDQTLLGNADIYNGKSALIEMAKEPRFMRRELSKAIINSIKRVPDFKEGMGRKLSSYPSFYPERRYVFLQVTPVSEMDYETEYRPYRQEMLKIACGVEKIKRPNSKKVIGIGIDVPKYSKGNSEDFVLLDCCNWSEEDESYYKEQNQELNFFKTDALKIDLRRSYEFPPDKKAERRIKIGRNILCPCGSNKKYKKCCLK